MRKESYQDIMKAIDVIDSRLKTYHQNLKNLERTKTTTKTDENLRQANIKRYKESIDALNLAKHILR